MSASTKAEAVALAYELAGWPNEGLGPGSKEKKSALLAIGAAVGLDLAGVPGKVECGRLVAEHFGVVWDQACFSRGETITLVGLNRLLDAATSPIDPGKAVQPSLALPSYLPLPQGVVPVSNEARSDLEQNIAERIATLSERGPVPDGTALSPDTWHSDAVTFRDGGWRTPLLEVQGWLHLPEPLAAAGAAAFDVSVAEALGAASAEQDVLFGRLADRLDRAVALRDRFLVRLEGEDEGAASLQTATQAWVRDWEEAEEEDAAEGTGPIQAEAKTWPIMQFVQHSTSGKLDLSPSYQRADVWATSDAQMLIESVVRGIPLPSVIILQSVGDDLRLSYEVVDGKQRLTSILRFIGEHPHALAVVQEKEEAWGEANLKHTFQRDYPTFKKLWKRHEPVPLSAQREREYHFPFPLRSGDVRALSGRLAQLRGKYFCQIRDEVITIVNEPYDLSAVFEQTTQYTVPVILYKQVTSSQIHEVFSLYNKQGKHLNAEEIRNALFHRLDLMRALLVTAGDAEDIAVVAPFLQQDWDDLQSTPGVLNEYGFGRAGYKRTKVLSWVAATLLAEDGVGSRSTAGTINALFEQVSEDRSHPLRRPEAVRSLMLLLDHAFDAHAAVPDEAWSPRFKNTTSRGAWQELQLVATVIALAAAQTVLGDSLDDVVESRLELLSERSAGFPWRRPRKTQTKAQWRYVADVVRDFLDILGVASDEADQQLSARFGRSGLAALVALRPLTPDEK